MSFRVDRAGWIAGAALLAGTALIGAALLSPDDEGSERSRADSSRGAPSSSTPPSPSAPPASRASTSPPSSRGWVGDDATDAVDVSRAGLEAPNDAGCTDAPDLMGVAKSVGGGFESYLREATAISGEEESELGRRLERVAPRTGPFRGRWDLADDVATYRDYLTRLVERLVALEGVNTRGLRFRVHLVRNETFNAMAFPGGVLAVHTGLLSGPRAVRSEAELMAVLGHEVAHVERRHPVATYQYVRALLGPGADDAAVLVRMMTLPLSSELEHEADERGTTLMAAAQYDAFAASRLWSRMAAQASGGRHGPEAVGGLLGSVVATARRVVETHPAPHRRCARTLEVARRCQREAQVGRWYRGERNLSERRPGHLHPY